jgi:hypothetical protein
MSHEALGDQFKFIQASAHNPEAASYYHQLRDPENRATALSWHKGTGEVFSINVASDRRRQGLATAMWHRAHAISAKNPDVIPPQHSRIRSPEGDAWARAVGGELPERDMKESFQG